jgi:hypothetical protein
VADPAASPWTQQTLLAELDALGMAHAVLEHPAIFTVTAPPRALGSAARRGGEEPAAEGRRRPALAGGCPG